MSAAEGIAETNKEFVAAYNSGNAAGVAACYTAEGQFKVPNAPTFEGREAVAGAFQGLLDAGISTVELKTTELEDFGETAIEHGEYILMSGDNIADKGRFMVHWQNVYGKWYLHRDIINSSQPAPE